MEPLIVVPVGGGTHSTFYNNVEESVCIIYELHYHPDVSSQVESNHCVYSPMSKIIPNNLIIPFYKFCSFPSHQEDEFLMVSIMVVFWTINKDLMIRITSLMFARGAQILQSLFRHYTVKTGMEVFGSCARTL